MLCCGHNGDFNENNKALSPTHTEIVWHSIILEENKDSLLTFLRSGSGAKSYHKWHSIRYYFRLGPDMSPAEICQIMLCFIVFLLHSHCRQKCPLPPPLICDSDLLWTAQITWNLIFSILIWATSICGPKSGSDFFFCNATSVWTVISEFMQF